MSKMPVIFVGHGSPMNAIEDNQYTRGWRKMAEKIPKPEAIISISAHWFTKGTRIMNERNQKTIYDMFGFPEELYKIEYNAPGKPELAATAKGLITKTSVFDNSWGIDHGTWSVLVHMYPERDIPVFQISIDVSAPPEEHYKIGMELKALRHQGVLIFGTGNIVHNLRLLDWGMTDSGFDWANEFDTYVVDSIANREHENIINYLSMGKGAKLSVPTPEHFYPILYILGASDEEDKISIYNKSCMVGSLSMTSYLFS